MAMLEHLHAEAGLEIDADTGLSEWEGDALDYEWALDALIKSGYMPTDNAGFPRVATRAALSQARAARADPARPAADDRALTQARRRPYPI